MALDFGFSLSPSSRVNLDNVNHGKFNTLIRAEHGVKECMACGSCSAVCAAGNFTRGTSLRRMILALQNGQEDKAMDYMKACMLCGKCTMVCPRGINTRHLILEAVRIYAK